MIFIDGERQKRAANREANSETANIKSNKKSKS